MSPVEFVKDARSLVFSQTYSTIGKMSSRRRTGVILLGESVRRGGAAVLLLAAAALAANPVQAQSAEAFFRSKSELTIATSGDAGGGYDAYSRLLSRHMGKYLPG